MEDRAAPGVVAVGTELDGAVDDEVLGPGEDREDLREPGAYLWIRTRDPAGRPVVEMGVGSEDLVEEVPVAGVLTAVV